MKYRLFWTPEAEAEFDSQLLRMSNSKRKEIMKLVREINSALVEAPNDFGESRYDNVRIGFNKPLACQVEIQEDVRTVILFDIWFY